MPAYAYLRKSSIQGSTDQSAETQERQVRLLAERFGDNHGSLVVLSDMDVSGQGKYTAKRKGYQALVEAVQTGTASSVYSYSLSRLGRSVAELSRFFALCEEHRVPVRLVADSIDTATASGRLSMNVLASVAQFEAEVASERLRARIALKREKGEALGAPRFGQKAGEDAPAVLDAFARAGSYRGAARILNEKGIQTRQGGPWGASSVSAIVRKADPSIRAPKRGVRVRGSFILSRLLICGTCRTPLTGTRQVDRRTEGHPIVRVVYECHRGHDLPHPKRSVHESVILPAIRAEAEHLVTPGAYETSTGDEREQRRLEAKRQRVIDNFEDGITSKAERDAKLLAIGEEFMALDQRRVLVQIPPIADIDWDDPMRANTLLRALFASVLLDPETYRPVEFAWTVPEWRAP